jgi:hypothetical protein
MWNSYVGSENKGVAIKTTVGRLKKAFAITNDPIYIGKVLYSEDPIVATGLIKPHFIKRRTFYGENELRLLVRSLRSSGEKQHYSAQELLELQPPDAQRILVNLHELIDSIVLKPKSDQSLKDIVDSLLSEAGLNIQSVFSETDRAVNIIRYNNN